MTIRKRAVATIAAAVLTASLTTVAVAGGGVALAQEDGELINNGDFSDGAAPWWWTEATVAAEATDGQLCAVVSGGTINPWDAIIGQSDLTLVAGQAYVYRFTASASQPVGVRALVHQPVDPFPTQLDQTVLLDTEPQTFEFSFESNADWDNAEVAFQVGGQAEEWTFCLDDVSLTSEVEHVVNGDFSNGTDSWWWTGNLDGAVVDGQLCTPVPAGTVNPWDAIVGQDGLTLQEGESYRFRVAGTADPPTGVRALVQLPEDPFPTQLDETVIFTEDLQEFEFTFTSTADWDGTAQIAFQIGGSAQEWTFCLDLVSLTSGAAPSTYEPDTGPRVRVNQVGYLPHGPKHATIVSDATEPLGWELRDATDAVVATGESTPHGLDETSDQNVHTVDFSDVTVLGSGYTLTADGETSFPFSISGDLYDELRLDTLKFYYPMRSGIEIDDALRPGYGRPAGHIQVPPNQGDLEVPCFQDTCDYTLDVSGGWYDAGDHGKYVVNGGISAWQVMNVWERANLAPAGSPELYGDGSLAIPESSNGSSDLLDEARWQLEFLLSMQVPTGEELAGMAHHKIHDVSWTGLPLLPHNDPQARFLHPPSTTATLNLAAAGAQCGRVFADVDPAFAAQCLAAAEAAWDAAVANPDAFAAPGGVGGGAYDDSDVSDEFYWAAAELFLTTGDQEYADAVLASEHHIDDIFDEHGFDWAWTAPAGRMQLATIPNDLPGIEDVRQSVVDAADGYLAIIDASPYGIVYYPADGLFNWGSNNRILNPLQVVATAYDLTGELRFRDGVLTGVDYILGRNALNISYVTGYGTVYSENQHSRWFAASLNPNLPHPPVGTIAGGPNSILEDDDGPAQQLLQGCAPQFCYVDDINSFGTNELTINWNAAIAWVASFLADQGDGSVAPPVSCDVSYHAGSLFGLLAGTVKVTNTGDQPIEGWELEWMFGGNQRILLAIGAHVTQSGRDVTATDLPWNATIRPGKSAAFAFVGTSKGPNPTPAQFTLNGATCT